MQSKRRPKFLTIGSAKLWACIWYPKHLNLEDIMEPTISPPNLFFSSENTASKSVTSEKEVFLATTIGKPVNYTIRAYPNQRIEIQLIHPPQHGRVEFHSDRAFSYQPRPSFKGVDTFSCHLQNELDRVTILPFTAIVSPPIADKKDREVKKNETPPLKPVISTPQFNTFSGKTLVKDIPVYEENEEPYTISLRKPAIHGRVKVYPDGTFEYAPSIGFHGKDSFQVSQHFAEGTENITIEVLVLKPVIKKPDSVTTKRSKGILKRKKR